MEALVVLQVFICLVLPLGLALRLWLMRRKGRSAVVTATFDLLTVLLAVMLIGRWDMAGHYLRFPVLVLSLAAILAAWLRHRRLPWRAPGTRRLTALGGPAFSAALLAALVAWLLPGAIAPRDAVALDFPLAQGRFAAAHGGGRVLVNYHASHEAQAYAADFVALNGAGYRARGLLPEDPAAYAIWDAPVLAPCAGRVTRARDGRPDMAPPKRDRSHPEGNHVVLDCAGLRVVLAHLRQGSVAVTRGDAVAPGDVLGRVGNSGNSTEPHLHIHAEDEEGIGVPVTPGGKWPLRNRVWQRP